MSLLTKLSNQAAAGGFTHRFVVTHEDLTETAERTVQNITVPVTAGQIVTNVSYRLVTAFNDSGGGDELDVEIGVTGGDVDGFLDNDDGNNDIHTDQTPASFGHGLGDLVSAGGHCYTADGSIQIAFTPDRANNTTYNLAECNAGEIHFYLRILDMSEQT